MNDMEKKYLSDLEVVQLAIEIEERGYEFYKLAAEKFRDDIIKGYFENLAREENKHRNMFQELYDVLADERKNDDSAYFDMEASIYLRSLFNTSVFPTKEKAQQKFESIKTPYDVIEIAIRAEKDSILFYDEIIKDAKYDNTKRIATILKNEETKHFLDLTHALKRLA